MESSEVQIHRERDKHRCRYIQSRYHHSSMNGTATCRAKPSQSSFRRAWLETARLNQPSERIRHRRRQSRPGSLTPASQKQSKERAGCFRFPRGVGSNATTRKKGRNNQKSVPPAVGQRNQPTTPMGRHASGYSLIKSSRTWQMASIWL